MQPDFVMHLMCDITADLSNGIKIFYTVNPIITMGGGGGLSGPFDIYTVGIPGSFFNSKPGILK